MAVAHERLLQGADAAQSSGGQLLIGSIPRRIIPGHEISRMNGNDRMVCTCSLSHVVLKDSIDDVRFLIRRRCGGLSPQNMRDRLRETHGPPSGRNSISDPSVYRSYLTQPVKD